MKIYPDSKKKQMEEAAKAANAAKEAYVSKDPPMELSIKERLRREREKIGQFQTNKEKRDYIWSYYKLHIIGTIVFLVLAGSFINDTIINPPPSSALIIAWSAGFELEETLRTLAESFYENVVDEYANETVQVLSFWMVGEPQHDMAQHTRFAAMSAAAELDIIIGEFFTNEEGGFDGIGLAPSWSFMDIRPVLQEAGIQIDDASDFLFAEGEDGREIAFAVSLEDTALLDGLGMNTMGQYLGVIINTRRHDAVVYAVRQFWVGT